MTSNSIPGAQKDLVNETPATANKSTSDGQFSLTEILDEMEARANAATPGPWDFDTDDLATWINAVAHPQPIAKMGSCTHFPKEDNANFIKAARSDLPKLVKALRRAVQYIENIGTDSEGYLYDGAQRPLNELAQLLREPADKEEEEKDL